MRVNVGCGRTPVPGWRNFDNSMSVRLAGRPFVTKVLSRLRVLKEDQRDFIQFVRHNSVSFAEAQQLPLPNGSVEVLYSSHMFEHLSQASASRFLKEVHRVLQKDGIFRLAVPDLSLLVSKYVESRDANALMSGMLVSDPLPSKLVPRVIRFATGDRLHQWMYDGPSLRGVLSQHGFRDPQVVPPGVTRIPNPGALDLYERADESVYVEAQRGD
jgi:SAM-dependent methyltransferase